MGCKGSRVPNLGAPTNKNKHLISKIQITWNAFVRGFVRNSSGPLRRRVGDRMLILTRRVGETVMISDDVTITVLDVKGNQCASGSTPRRASRCTAKRSTSGSNASSKRAGRVRGRRDSLEGEVRVGPPDKPHAIRQAAAAGRPAGTHPQSGKRAGSASRVPARRSGDYATPPGPFGIRRIADTSSAAACGSPFCARDPARRRGIGWFASPARAHAPLACAARCP